MTRPCAVCGEHQAAPDSVLCELCIDGYLVDLDETLDSGDDSVSFGIQSHCALMEVATGEGSGCSHDDPDECGTHLREQHEWMVANPSWAPALTMHMRDLRDHSRGIL